MCAVLLWHCETAITKEGARKYLTISHVNHRVFYVRQLLIENFVINPVIWYLFTVMYYPKHIWVRLHVPMLSTLPTTSEDTGMSKYTTTTDGSDIEKKNKSTTKSRLQESNIKTTASRTQSKKDWKTALKRHHEQRSTRVLIDLSRQASWCIKQCIYRLSGSRIVNLGEVWLLGYWRAIALHWSYALKLALFELLSSQKASTKVTVSSETMNNGLNPTKTDAGVKHVWVTALSNKKIEDRMHTTPSRI